MTQKEIDKFLANTKVYVNGKSKEIQEKLFSLGYTWNTGSIEVGYTTAPFLFIHKDMSFTQSSDMELFIDYPHHEISAEKILSLELIEPTYRPFKDREECWNEMLKHQPFGWIKNTEDGDYYPIGNVYNEMDFKDWLRIYRFADDTPFGIKEE